MRECAERDLWDGKDGLTGMCGGGVWVGDCGRSERFVAGGGCGGDRVVDEDYFVGDFKGGTVCLLVGMDGRRGGRYCLSVVGLRGGRFHHRGCRCGRVGQGGRVSVLWGRE